MTNLVPFGKYKGQTVERLLDDREYTEWLLAQAWFRERFKPLYTVVINNGAEPSDTPEHNALQARFLDHAFIDAFIEVYVPNHHAKNYDRAKILLEEYKTLYSQFDEARLAVISTCQRTRREYHHNSFPGGVDVPDPCHLNEDNYYSPCSNCRGRILQKLGWKGSPFDHNAKFRQYKPWDPESPYDKVDVWQRVENLVFERGGVDVAFTFFSSYDITEDEGPTRMLGECIPFGIEIKPTMGDDYPSVLRQCLRTKGVNTLLCASYTGIGADLESIRKIFGASKIKVVMLSEIEAQLQTLTDWHPHPPPFR